MALNLVMANMVMQTMFRHLDYCEDGVPWETLEVATARTTTAAMTKAKARTAAANSKNGGGHEWTSLRMLPIW